MKKTAIFFFCFLVALAATCASAETRYVTDTLIVTVRDNPGSDYKIVETLPTASPVQILDEDKTFVKVRTEKGNEGYILKQYITSQTPKKIVISRLQQQITQLQGQLDEQKKNCQGKIDLAASSQAKFESTSTELKTAQQQLAKVTGEYKSLKESSGHVVALQSERDKLTEENNRLSSELEVLQKENRSFHRSNMIQWFLAGGGVFFGGWLVGKLSRKKRGFSRL